MHRHGYKQRKLGRTKDFRRLLLKGLASDLILNTKLQTTLPKAKEVLPYVERLITKAKKGDLHNRRLIISRLNNKQSAHKLVDQIAPQLKDRQSGHLRLIKNGFRQGDHAPLASISFVDQLATENDDVSETEEVATPKVVAKPTNKEGA